MSATTLFLYPETSTGSANLARLLRSHGPAFTNFARQRNPEIPRLETLLEQIEARLGTEAEREDDFARCREIAHRLASLFCIGALVDFVGHDARMTTPCGAERLAS